LVVWDEDPRRPVVNILVVRWMHTLVGVPRAVWCESARFGVPVGAERTTTHWLSHDELVLDNFRVRVPTGTRSFGMCTHARAERWLGASSHRVSLPSEQLEPPAPAQNKVACISPTHLTGTHLGLLGRRERRGELNVSSGRCERRDARIRWLRVLPDVALVAQPLRAQ
jgi:hypothetical protein